MKTTIRMAVVFLGSLAIGGQSFANSVGYDAEYRADYTDNALQAQSNEEKIGEITHNYRLGFFGNLSGARSKTDFIADVEFVDYQDDLSEDEALTSFLGSSEIALTSRTLSWYIADALGYYDPEPGLRFNSRNQERVNYFITGPVFDYEVAPGKNIGSKLLYTRHDRDGRDEDYERLNFDVSWDQQLSIRDNWGLGVDHTLMRYSEESDREDYNTTDLRVFFDRKTPSNIYSLSVGGTYLQTENEGTDTSAVFDALWDHSFTRRSGLVLEAGYELTDASVLRGSQLGQAGEFTNTAEPGLFYETRVGARFRYRGVASDFSFEVDGRSLDYVDGPAQASLVNNDHNTYGVSSSYRKYFGRIWDFEIALGADYKDYVEGDFEDTLYTATFTSNYALSRSLDLTFELEHQEGEGNLPSADGSTGDRTYEENTVSIGLLWDPYKSRRTVQNYNDFSLSIIN